MVVKRWGCGKFERSRLQIIDLGVKLLAPVDVGDRGGLVVDGGCGASHVDGTVERLDFGERIGRRRSMTSLLVVESEVDDVTLDRRS